MKLVSARPSLLLSPKDTPQRMDSKKTGNNDVSESIPMVWRMSELEKNAFTTCHCTPRLTFNACQNVTGTLCEMTASSGSKKYNDNPNTPYKNIRRRKRRLKKFNFCVQMIAVMKIGKKPTSAQFSVIPAP